MTLPAVRRHEWAHGWWEVVELPVHPRLTNAVLGPYVGWHEYAVRPVVRREVASVVVPLIVSFGSPFALLGAGETAPEMRGSFVAGLYDRWVDIAMPRESRAMQINLTPLAARRVFGVPLHEVLNRSVDIESIFGAEGRSLIEQMGNAISWPARAALLDTFLMQRLDRALRMSSPVVQSWRALVSTHGNQSIASLHLQTGWSPRRLGDAFRDAVGMTPRHVGTVLRFQRATSLVHAASSAARRVHWSTIAAECGYADHAHLTRSFRKFAGQTPSEYAAERAALGIHAASFD
jgi:AraC-like DNA-binding protein